MQCKYYKHLIILSKTGSNTPRQEKQLNAHLSECHRCMTEWENNFNTDKAIDFVKSNRVRLANPEELTNRIMKAVERRANLPFHERLLNFLDQIHYFLFFRRMKYALVTVASILILLFIQQEFMFLNKRNQLNKKPDAISLSRSKKQIDAIQYKNVSLNLQELRIIDKISEEENEIVHIYEAEYADLIKLILALEKENAQLRSMLGNDYKRIIAEIENEYKQVLTPEEKSILKKLKEI